MRYSQLLLIPIPIRDDLKASLWVLSRFIAALPWVCGLFYCAGWISYGVALRRKRPGAALVCAGLLALYHYGVLSRFYNPAAVPEDIRVTAGLCTLPLPIVAVLAALYLFAAPAGVRRRTGVVLSIATIVGGLLAAALFAVGRPIPPQAPVELALTWQHACGRLPSGKVACAGSNYSGQLDGSMRFFVEGITDAQQIYAGDGLGCAVRSEGRVSCWGGGERLRPLAADGLLWDVPASAGTLRLSLGDDELYGLRADGSVYGWPDAPPDEAQGAQSVQTRNRRSCAVLRGGQIVWWKRTNEGRLEGVITLPDMDDAISAAPTTDGGCAVRNDGSVRCWYSDARHPLEVQWSNLALADVREVIGVWDADYAFRTGDGSVVLLWDRELRPMPELGPAIRITATRRHVCSTRRDKTGDLVPACTSPDGTPSPLHLLLGDS